VIKRVFVEKRKGFNTEALDLMETFRKNLNIQKLENVRMIYRYEIEGIEESVYQKAKQTIFSEPNVDLVTEDHMNFSEKEKVIAYEYLPGQYDQHADFAMQCVQILSGKKPLVKVTKILALTGDLNEKELQKIISYTINPVDSRQIDLIERSTLEEKVEEPESIPNVCGFIDWTEKELEDYRHDAGYAMSFQDLLFVQAYFRDEEKRDPSETELKVIDTYWSDHCRHTTFSTVLRDATFDEGNEDVRDAFYEYLALRVALYGDKIEEKPVTLMDLATIGAKSLKESGIVTNIDESEEVNACSIEIDLNHDGVIEPWLLMFKNETHNHPTEIEPFGGAATCLGGAIRDPLSGRSYVYQAMRLTGAWDPRTPIEETLPGKLPQRKICIEAAQGYSSYGNQIGLATGQVAEVYHPGFLAKRMEVGAVVAAAPRKNVDRRVPAAGDRILLVGGRTGRDGIGGATGSSKGHTEESIHTSGAEVQKGNPVEERKIQRFFRQEKVARMIKRCNDFGAGGVSVAIGELADSLRIDLDAVPKKYEGLNGTELALSESQERMAVVISSDNVDAFIELGHTENLEITEVAEVTDDGRLVMTWRGEEILNLSREFLNTNGATQFARVHVATPVETTAEQPKYFTTAVHELLSDINVASQKGLIERFDASIGAGTLAMPLGGVHGLTPQDGMAAKLPVETGDTTTASVMTYGYRPDLTEKMPFKGGEMAVAESLSKLVAMGARHRDARLSFQEYFERLGNDPTRWGKPFGALLGGLKAQLAFGTPAIGGKDSMFGTFEDLSVPPTIISFAVAPTEADRVTTSELKRSGTYVSFFPLVKNDEGTIDYDETIAMYDRVEALMAEGKVLSAKAVGRFGLIESLLKMSFGNKIGTVISEDLTEAQLFEDTAGGLLLETKEIEEDWQVVAKTVDQPTLTYGETTLELDDLIERWEAPLRDVYPEKQENGAVAPTLFYQAPKIKTYYGVQRGSPRVIIPVFPGTNCEVETAKAFVRAGAQPEIVLFKNRDERDILDSIEHIAKAIEDSQIIMLSGGFSGGDQPEGSGKFIATVFRNPRIMDAVQDLLENRDGLMLGICNGFQALIKLGLVPYGRVMDLEVGMPTLSYNKIHRHVSTIAATKVVSNLSPWLAYADTKTIYHIPVSHGEGRFMADEKTLKALAEKGQIATQYVDLKGLPTMDGNHNPNGSDWAIEGITSEDGRIFGKMGHSERIGHNLYKNVPGEKDQKIFEAGVAYFK
jgi:phosphoribosylformylglycinamidine synthase